MWQQYSLILFNAMWYTLLLFRFTESFKDSNIPLLSFFIFWGSVSYPSFDHLIPILMYYIVGSDEKKNNLVGLVVHHDIFGQVPESLSWFYCLSRLDVENYPSLGSSFKASTYDRQLMITMLYSSRSFWKFKLVQLPFSLVLGTILGLGNGSDVSPWDDIVSNISAWNDNG